VYKYSLTTAVLSYGPPYCAALSYGPPYSAAFSECPTTAVLSYCPPYLLLSLTALLTLLLSLNALLLLSFPTALPTCCSLFHGGESRAANSDRALVLGVGGSRKTKLRAWPRRDFFS
jgi:hypothetical protein